jgi:hypothetical protein
LNGRENIKDFEEPKKVSTTETERNIKFIFSGRYFLLILNYGCFLRCITEITGRDIPEDNHLRIRRRENLKSYLMIPSSPFFNLIPNNSFTNGGSVHLRCVFLYPESCHLSVEFF